MITVVPVTGIGEVRPGTDLGSMLAGQMPWLADGDVVVVTSKIVSKAEGRLVAVGSDDPLRREAARQQAIDDETVRVVARRGELRIVANRHGVVMAGAGVDASNVARDEIALLPVDPDASAAALRAAFAIHLGVRVGVVVSDSLGRAWRAGIIDQALGAAGIVALRDLRGVVDSYGNVLNATLVAGADEIASAADLAKGKLGGIPVAVVRGLDPGWLTGTAAAADLGTRPLVRDGTEDMFRLGTDEGIAQGRAEGVAEGIAQGRADGIADGIAEGIAQGRADGVRIGRADAVGAAGPAGPLHEDACAVITALPDMDPGANALRQAYLGFLLARPDAVWRSCVPGHLTASTVVVDAAHAHVLLTLHPRLGKWVQVGGHCEPEDVTVLAAAVREADEESGMADLRFDPVPIHLDVHGLTCSLGVPTRHFDVRFLAVAPVGAQPAISDESLDLRWFAWDDLPPGTDDLAPMLAAARARLARTAEPSTCEPDA